MYALKRIAEQLGERPATPRGPKMLKAAEDAPTQQGVGQQAVIGVQKASLTAIGGARAESRGGGQRFEEPRGDSPPLARLELRNLQGELGLVHNLLVIIVR